MVFLHCNYSDLLAQEPDLRKQTNIHRCTMDFYQKEEIFDVRGPGFHPKPLSILITLGECVLLYGLAAL